MQGPRRNAIIRSEGYVGPAPTIGPPPKSAPESTEARYQAIKSEKIRRDRQARRTTPSRGRKAAPMKPRSRGEVIRNGGSAAQGGGGGGVPMGAPESDWWKHPWLWAAALGAYFLIQRKKK